MQRKRNLYHKSRYYKQRQRKRKRIFAAAGAILLLFVFLAAVQAVKSQKNRLFSHLTARYRITRSKVTRTSVIPTGKIKILTRAVLRPIRRVRILLPVPLTVPTLPLPSQLPSP